MRESCFVKSDNRQGGRALNQLIKNLAYQLTRKWVREETLTICEIEKKREELSFFSLSTNPIISFEQDGEIWYFRECPRILREEAYWTEVIARFFDSLERLGISQTHFAQEIPVRITFDEKERKTFQNYVENKYHDRAFRKTLANADQIAKSVHFSIWEKQSYDSAFFARFAFADLPENCREIAVLFLWNMRSAAGNYRLMKIVRGKRHSFFAATKAAASRIVAEELHVAHMITPVQWCRLTVDDGSALFGVLSPSAPGQRMLDSAVTLTGSLQRELLCLNVLDVICFQPDHGPNNYNVAASADGQITICAFDNDNPQTLFPGFSVCRPLAGCTTLVDGSNRIQRPYMDRSLAVHLRNLDKAKLRRRLKPYLNSLQIVALCCRLDKINRAILKTERNQPDFLKDRDCWNFQTAAEEVSGKYGETYLKKVGSTGATTTS